MRIFLDTAEVAEIRRYADWGVVDGVTTNPSLVARSGRVFEEVVAEICAIVDGPVSAEVTALDAAGMVAEGRRLAAIHPNVVVKVPLVPEGLKATAALRADGVDVNVTLCFSLPQALLAAKAGATYVSPFVGRLDDLGQDGMALIDEIVTALRAYPALDTQVLVASVRNAEHVRRAALLGADAVTLPPKVLEQLVAHELTRKGLEAFLADWNRRAGAAPDPAAPRGPGAPGGRS